MQFDFAGPLPLADGRYLARASDIGEESVLVLQQLGASPLGRRGRRGRGTAEPEPAPLALSRATAIRAFAPFESEEEAARWLDETCEAEDTVVDILVSEGIGLLNRALHAQAVVAADPFSRHPLTPEGAERVLIGYGSGEETAAGRFRDARQIDVSPRGSHRRRREEDLRPQERVAALLRGREQLDACETLLLRARADLDTGRTREAALQLRVGLEALLLELKGALTDPGHESDMGTLQERKHEAGAVANAALEGELTPEQQQQVEDLLRISERILRRRRVLRG